MSSESIKITFVCGVGQGCIRHVWVEEETTEENFDELPSTEVCAM